MPKFYTINFLELSPHPTQANCVSVKNSDSNKLLNTAFLLQKNIEKSIIT